MSRRVIMPTADDLFRPTVVPEPGAPYRAPEEEADERVEPSPETRQPGRRRKPRHAGEDGQGEPAPSGRVRHDEKMTVYVTADELLDIEHARLDLRRHHGLAVDRGRLVRAAVSIALTELADNGADSQIVRRLQMTPRGA